jgi:hypothetical protein
LELKLRASGGLHGMAVESGEVGLTSRASGDRCGVAARGSKAELASRVLGGEAELRPRAPDGRAELGSRMAGGFGQAAAHGGKADLELGPAARCGSLELRA